MKNNNVARETLTTFELLNNKNKEQREQRKQQSRIDLLCKEPKNIANM